APNTRSQILSLRGIGVGGVDGEPCSCVLMLLLRRLHRCCWCFVRMWDPESGHYPARADFAANRAAKNLPVAEEVSRECVALYFPALETAASSFQKQAQPSIDSTFECPGAICGC